MGHWRIILYQLRHSNRANFNNSISLDPEDWPGCLKYGGGLEAKIVERVDIFTAKEYLI